MNWNGSALSHVALSFEIHSLWSGALGEKKVNGLENASVRDSFVGFLVRAKCCSLLTVNVKTTAAGQGYRSQGEGTKRGKDDKIMS